MKRWKTLAVAAALAAATAGAASAEISIEGVYWQVGRVESGRVSAWQNAAAVPSAPPKLDGRLRARLVLKNVGPLEEGLLLRYSMTARIAPAQGAPVDGTWAVPFRVDERHVPKIGADKTLEIPLDVGPELNDYLGRMTRAGWWPDRLKIQVMLEPRSGSKTIPVAEAVLEVKNGAKP